MAVLEKPNDLLFTCSLLWNGANGGVTINFTTEIGVHVYGLFMIFASGLEWDSPHNLHSIHSSGLTIKGEPRKKIGAHKVESRLLMSVCISLQA